MSEKKGRVYVAQHLQKQKVMVDKDGNLIDITELGRKQYKEGKHKLDSGEGERQAF